MGIKEAIDRAVPDLEYEVDEITARANQLKEMALKEKTVPKDKDTDQPKKYVSGLSDKDKKAHDKHLEKGSKKSDKEGREIRYALLNSKTSLQQRYGCMERRT